MSEKRFEEVYVQGKLKVIKVVRDNETGVLYMLHQQGYGAGLTIMVDQDGKPLINEITEYNLKYHIYKTKRTGFDKLMPPVRFVF